MKALLILCALLPLSGCLSMFDRHSALPPTPAKISKYLKMPCARLLDIPDKDLTANDLQDIIAAQRIQHGACIRKDDKLIKAAEALEKQGQKP